MVSDRVAVYCHHAEPLGGGGYSVHAMNTARRQVAAPVVDKTLLLLVVGLRQKLKMRLSFICYYV